MERTGREWLEWAQQTEGCYILRTNVSGWSSEELWRTYIQLTEAEAAFRIQKTDLSIRHIRHQKAERVQAHLFVCFLAYVMWKTLDQWQSRSGRVTAAARFWRNWVGSGASMSCYSWPINQVERSGCAVWSGMTRIRRCCSIGWV